MALGADPVRRARAHRHRPALPGDGGVLRRRRAVGPHDDVQHRGHPDQHRPGSPTTRSPTAGGWPTRSARRSSPASPTRRSPRAAPTGWQSSRLRSWWAPRPAPAPAPVPTDGDPATEWLELRARRQRHAHPRRRRHYRRVTEPLTVRRVDGRWPRARLADARRLRLPPHHAVPAGPAQGLVRAAHVRRAARRRSGTSPWRSPTRCSPTPRPRADAAGPSPAPTDLWVDAAQLGLGHPALAAPRPRRASSRPRRARRGGRTTPTVDVVAAYFDRWVPAAAARPTTATTRGAATGALVPPRESPVRLRVATSPLPAAPAMTDRARRHVAAPHRSAADRARARTLGLVDCLTDDEQLRAASRR